MEEKEKTDGRGGARPGAGRKKVYVGGKQFCFNAGAAVSMVIDSQPDRTAFINACIQEHIEREEIQMPDLSLLGRVYGVDEEAEAVLPIAAGRVACGSPIDTDRDTRTVIDMMRQICPHPDRSFVVQTQGESMIDADIHDGDLIVVDASVRVPMHSKPMLCELNGSYTVKFVEHDTEGYWLRPANETFADIPVEEGDTFNIWGMVVSVVHRF